jgi:hypothetical protein
MQGYNSLANKYPELFLSSDSIDEVVKAIVYNKNVRQIGNRFKNERSSWKYAESGEFYSDLVAIWHKVNMEHNLLYKQRLEALKKPRNDSQKSRR